MCNLDFLFFLIKKSNIFLQNLDFLRRMSQKSKQFCLNMSKYILEPSKNHKKSLRMKKMLDKIAKCIEKSNNLTIKRLKYTLLYCYKMIKATGFEDLLQFSRIFVIKNLFIYLSIYLFIYLFICII